MAADWIKMRSNLWDDPRVARICDLAGSSEATVVGGLYRLWSMADQHSSDGHLSGLSLGALDRKTGVKGLGAALVAVGWLVEDADGLTIPEFEEHNSASAKKRAQTARRVANCKANGNATAPEAEPDQSKEVTQSDAKGNAPSVTSALPREREREDIRGCKHPPAQSPGNPASGAAQPAASPPDGEAAVVGNGAAPLDGLPPCPAEQVIALYHEVLPELPRCRITTDARAKALRRRWRWVLTSRKPDGTPRACTPADAMVWFRAFFDRARASDWLMGRSARGAGHEGWQCDLDFLLSDKGLKAVVEKTEATA